MEYRIQEETLTALADAVRSKSGTTALLSTTDMINGMQKFVPSTIYEGTNLCISLCNTWYGNAPMGLLQFMVSGFRTPFGSISAPENDRSTYDLYINDTLVKSGKFFLRTENGTTQCLEQGTTTISLPMYMGAIAPKVMLTYSPTTEFYVTNGQWSSDLDDYLYDATRYDYDGSRVKFNYDWWEENIYSKLGGDYRNYQNAILYNNTDKDRNVYCPAYTADVPAHSIVCYINNYESGISYVSDPIAITDDLMSFPLGADTVNSFGSIQINREISTPPVTLDSVRIVHHLDFDGAVFDFDRTWENVNLPDYDFLMQNINDNNYPMSKDELMTLFNEINADLYDYEKEWLISTIGFDMYDGLMVDSLPIE